MADSRQESGASGRWLRWLALSVVAIGAPLLVFGLLEVAARTAFPQRLEDACQQTSGPPPNCISSMQVAEGPSVEMRYSDCGYRARASCETKPAGSLRVGLLGTSIAWGYGVAFDDSISGLSAIALSRACNRPVDVQTVPVNWPRSESAEDRQKFWDAVSAAVQTRPDAVVILAATFDLGQFAPNAGQSTGAPPSAGWKALPGAETLRGAVAKLREWREAGKPGRASAAAFGVPGR